MSKNMTRTMYDLIFATLLYEVLCGKSKRLCLRDNAIWHLPHMCEPYHYLVGKGCSPKVAKKKAALSIGKILSKIMKQHPDKWEVVKHGFITIYKRK